MTILGSGAAIPTADRNPTAQVVHVRNHTLLLDCGEGTQVRLRKSSVRMQKISHIFISHLHGDHYFGLIGLINTMHILGRKQELHIFAIEPLKKLIDLQLELSNTTLVYPLIFHPIETESPQIILEDEQITVTTIPLNHRVPTTGFLIKEKPSLRKIRRDFVAHTTVPPEYYERIRNGEDFTDEQGNVHPNHLITDAPTPPKSYAFCSDTAFFEPVIPIIRNCDLLYHEATFMEDKAADAKVKFHSTAKEAALIALKANANKLVIGHFSARYGDAEGLLKEAREIFPETIIAEEGITILV